MDASDMQEVARLGVQKRDRPTLVWQLTDRGFGSEIHYLLLGAVYSLAEDYNFLLYSRTWNASAGGGWRDYFLGYCQEVDHIALRYACIFRKPNWYWRSAFAARRAVMTFVLPTPFYFTNERWLTVRDPAFKRRRFALGAGPDTDLFGACRRILLAIWKFNPATAREIARRHAQVMGNEKPYATIHIRRGDKKRETPYVAVERYIERVRALNAGIERLVVMTDDYGAVQDIAARCPQYEVVTLCPPNRRGHLQKEFNAITRAQRREETLLLLTELEIARGGEFFVGTYSSNIGKIVALLRGKETTHSLDVPELIL